MTPKNLNVYILRFAHRKHSAKTFVKLCVAEDILYTTHSLVRKPVGRTFAFAGLCRILVVKFSGFLRDAYFLTSLEHIYALFWKHSDRFYEIEDEMPVIANG